MTGNVKGIYVIWITTVIKYFLGFFFVIFFRKFHIFLLFLTSPSVKLKIYNAVEKNVIQYLNILKYVYIDLYITFGKLIFNVNIYACRSVKTTK